MSAKSSQKRLAKVPKGARDYYDENAECLDFVRRTANEIFRDGYGAKKLVTPVFELTDFLLSKYGEEAEQKLIYNLADQGGEQLSLRYDQTLPLVRYIIENRLNKGRVYQIGQVYRRDNPSTKCIRLREFTQADIDFIGEYPPMEAELKIMSIVTDVMKDLKIANFKIRINFRQNLLAMFQAAGIPTDLFKTICSSIDKLDKMSFDELVPELAKKGLDTTQIKKLREILECEFISAQCRQWYDRLLSLATKLGIEEFLAYDPFLARGLDYYTGIIYEVGVKGFSGSVAAGGRYDDLVKQSGGQPTKMIGVSFGLNRLANIASSNILPRFMIIGIPTSDKNLSAGIFERKLALVKIIKEEYGSGVEYSLRDRNIKKQLAAANDSNIDYALIIGETEIKSNTVIIKDIQDRTNISQQILTFDPDSIDQEKLFENIDVFRNGIFKSLSGSASVSVEVLNET